jgi:dephospho-CoA kinase
VICLVPLSETNMSSTIDNDSRLSASQRSNERQAIPVVGLIGGIGSGKSLVANLMSQRGAIVINADAVGHEVLEEPEIRRQIVARFGPGVVRTTEPNGMKEGLIDRRALGSLVFADRSALRDLERIVHPVMKSRFIDVIESERRRGLAPAVVLDAAILLEAGWDDLCDRIVFVDASWPVRLARVSRSRGWTAETLRAREASQWPCETKKSMAHVVLPNDDPDGLDQKVDWLFEFLAAGQTESALLPEGVTIVSEPETYEPWDCATFRA